MKREGEKSQGRRIGSKKKQGEGRRGENKSTNSMAKDPAGENVPQAGIGLLTGIVKTLWAALLRIF